LKEKQLRESREREKQTDPEAKIAKGSQKP
jgi:hypothetical protein